MKVTIYVSEELEKELLKEKSDCYERWGYLESVDDMYNRYYITEEQVKRGEEITMWVPFGIYDDDKVEQFERIDD